MSLALMTPAAVERRFRDLPALHREFQLARERRARTVDIGPVRIRSGVPTVRVRVEVVPAPRPRFPRWPKLPKVPEWLGWASLLWNNQDTIMEAARGILDALLGLFRRRAARAGVP